MSNERLPAGTLPQLAKALQEMATFADRAGLEQAEPVADRYGVILNFIDADHFASWITYGLLDPLDEATSVEFDDGRAYARCMTMRTISPWQVRASWPIPKAPAEYVGRHRAPDDQDYYWTPEWQENERAAVEEIKRGDVHTFTKSSDAIAWLKADDESGGAS